MAVSFSLAVVVTGSLLFAATVGYMFAFGTQLNYVFGFGNLIALDLVLSYIAVNFSIAVLLRKAGSAGRPAGPRSSAPWLLRRSRTRCGSIMRRR
jgi:hypothetical protein